MADVLEQTRAVATKDGSVMIAQTHIVITSAMAMENVLQRTFVCALLDGKALHAPIEYVRTIVLVTVFVWHITQVTHPSNIRPIITMGFICPQTNLSILLKIPSNSRALKFFLMILTFKAPYSWKSPASAVTLKSSRLPPQIRQHHRSK
jgi:hypothetical protein